MAGIYLHIPFCKKRCIYCDFFSSTKSEKKAAYIDALCQELELRRDYLDEERIETIYFGGGTPSQLTKEDFERIFSSLYKIYPISPEAEITLEANPDDLSPEYIHMLRTLPFNRLSMGIQTFNENTLKLLQRRHTAQQAIEAFTRCREAGFHNISIDLMYGLPGETMAGWEKDLQQALEMKPEHISAYHLIYDINFEPNLRRIAKQIQREVQITIGISICRRINALACNRSALCVVFQFLPLRAGCIDRTHYLIFRLSLRGRWGITAAGGEQNKYHGRRQNQSGQFFQHFHVGTSSRFVVLLS